MAFDFNKGEAVAQGIRTPDERSVFGKAGDFLLPQTTEHLRRSASGEGSTFREGAAVATEIASFAPVGRTLKAGLAGTQKLFGSLRNMFKPKKAREVAPGDKESLFRTGAREGATAGALFEGAQGLGDPDAEIDDILKRAGVGAIYGAAGGAVLAPALGGATRAVGAGTSAVRNLLRKSVGDETPEELVGTVTDSLTRSFVEDRPAMLNGLNRIAQRYKNSLGDIGDNELVQEVAEAGYIPEVRGQVANFKAGIDDVEKKQGTLSEAVTKLVQRFDTTGEPVITLQKFNDDVLEAIQRRTDIDIASAESQFRRRMQAIQKEHGVNLSATAVDEIRRQANKKGPKGTFVADVNSEVGRVARNVLDEVNPDIRRLNESHNDLEGHRM